jgi:hypothetical protein
MALPTIREALDELGLELPPSRKLTCPNAHASGKTPSLHVYEDHFYCFGCGTHGDGIGLVALYTGQPIKRLYAERKDDGGGPSYGARSKTRGQKTDARGTVRRQYRELHNWWFGSLAEIHANSPEYLLLRALDLWSDYFEVLDESIRGEDGEDRSPYQAEQLLREARRELEAAEPFERQDAQRAS